MLDRETFLSWVVAIATAGCTPAASPANTRASQSRATELAGTAAPANTTGSRSPAVEPAPTPAPPDPTTLEPVTPVVTVAPPDCASWTPDPGCEGAKLVRSDCEGMVETLDPAVSSRAFECALAQPVKNAVCGVSFAT